MKSALTFAPPAPARRHRPLPLEPFIFAALLLVLTVGINIAAAPVAADEQAAREAQQADPMPVAVSALPRRSPGHEEQH